MRLTLERATFVTRFRRSIIHRLAGFSQLNFFYSLSSAVFGREEEGKVEIFSILSSKLVFKLRSSLRKGRCASETTELKHMSGHKHKQERAIENSMAQ